MSPASDNPAVLADISGTVIELNSVFFEGASFLHAAEGRQATATMAACLRCSGKTSCAARALALGIGTDCFGAAMPAVRYDSPTWGGFRFETSWGKNDLTGGTAGGGFTSGLPTPEANFWDIAVFYTADWNSIKLSAAAAYTWQESSALYGSSRCLASATSGTWRRTCFSDQDLLKEDNLFQIGASILHKPSGLGIYGMYQTEETSGSTNNFVGLNDASFFTDLDGTLTLLALRCSSRSTTRRPTSGT